ncbi:DUF6542 domain-containing protein [Nakamurella lactea]|uniref:DUF6542 domain-containing protein n=1 Tax=Nakamurella lactea TaxID=459515 RepID=UPI0012B5677A|nr:DUF6542 domain-containing protein [Nakamurella lactea]
MTTTAARPTGVTTTRAHASVVPSMPGVPWYGAVLLALLVTAIGLMIGGNDFSDGVPAALWVCFLAGCGLAVLVVRRHAVFTTMVQPPLVLAVVVLVGGRMFAGLDSVFAGVNVVKTFPLMCVGTGLAILLGLLRMVAEPTRPRRSA